MALITLFSFSATHALAQGSGSRQPTQTSDPYFNAGSSEAKVAKKPVDPMDRYRITERHSIESDQMMGTAFQPGMLLAVVGGEPIFLGDVLFEANQLIQRFMKGAPENLVTRERPKIIKRILPKYIDQKLLLIDAKRGLPEGANFDDIIEKSSAEFDEKALEQLIQSSGVSGPAEFDAQLRAQGSSLRKLRRSWTVDQIVRFLLSKKLETSTEVSHHELLDHYRDNESEYQIKARAKWEQVMVRFDRMDNKTAAKKAIIEMGNKIVYGAPLDAIAKKMSHGFRAQSGGQFDWTTKNSLVLKQLDKAIFELPVGELSDIIETRDGFHIVRVVEREDAGKVEFRDAQVEIRKKLVAGKRAAAFEQHIAKLRKEIPVEIFDLPAETPMNGSFGVLMKSSTASNSSDVTRR